MSEKLKYNIPGYFLFDHVLARGGKTLPVGFLNEANTASCDIAIL